MNNLQSEVSLNFTEYCALLFLTYFHGKNMINSLGSTIMNGSMIEAAYHHFLVSADSIVSIEIERNDRSRHIRIIAHYCFQS